MTISSRPLLLFLEAPLLRKAAQAPFPTGVQDGESQALFTGSTLILYVLEKEDILDGFLFYKFCCRLSTPMKQKTLVTNYN